MSTAPLGASAPRHLVTRTLAVVALAAGLSCQALGATAPGDNAAQVATQDTGYALVQLSMDPLSTAARTKPLKGKKIDFSSNAVKSHRALLSKARNDYKAWLRANVPQVQISGEFDIALNAVSLKLNGATLTQIAATAMVKDAQYQGLYRKNVVTPDPDLALINAESAWARNGGPANAGAGVKVGIIDSGIDNGHPCFSDAGYPAQNKLGDPKYTNNKVIVARVFNNKLNQNGFDAKAVDSHGTHVAGTVACNHQTPATVQGVAIPYGISGVAPRALLGNYNVFPGNVASARSEDILNALDAAYADGMDVANMSLGGGGHGFQDLLTVAVDNLDQANMVVAISNGNEGPGAFTVGSPGMAAGGLTAGASSVPHYIGATVAVGATSVGAVRGDFPVVPAAGLSAPLAVVAGTVNGLNDACVALPAGSLSGAIALISRGTCAFSVKLRNAQAAGAAAVLVANNVAGDPTPMGTDGAPSQPTVPAYMVGRAEGQALKALSGTATISGTLSYVQSANANIMAGFSSQGPTDVELRVKPDLVAPGVNVLSSVPRSFCGATATSCFDFFSGTSMASPHLAGSAAIVRQQHPTWSAAEVRSAIVNTAAQGVLKRFEDAAPTNDVNIIGAGLDDLGAAVIATVALDPVSVSFGGVPSGSGQARSETVTLSNLTASPITVELAASAQGAGVGYSVSPASVAIAAGGTATVTVTASAAVGAPSGGKAGMLRVKVGGSEVAHGVLFTVIK